MIICTPILRNSVEIKCVDFQLCRWSNPTIDLSYFFGSSTSPEFRTAHLGEMLRLYHDRLTENLARFGYGPEVYGFDQLEKDFQERFVIGFVMGIIHSQASWHSVAPIPP